MSLVLLTSWYYCDYKEILRWSLNDQINLSNNESKFSLLRENEEIF